MKSAGWWTGHSPCVSRGQPACANGMAPESNQQSTTSGVRHIVPAQRSQVSVTSSMKGRCGSNSSGRPSSASEDGARSASQRSQIQTLSGVPQ
jgi:hypothetical protein